MTNLGIDNTGLIERARSDPNAFAELYLRHYEIVFKYCTHRLFESHCAEEVTSTVFFKVMHNLDSFEGTEIDFRNWLLRIATNAVNDYLRDARKRIEIIQKAALDIHTQSTVTIDCDEKLLEKKAFLQKAILSLKPKYQAVITLHFFENMKLTEIATCLGKNPSTVRTWLNRACTKLRKKLQASVGNGE
ncbi:MAG: RNA polymerase sigma factor [Sedimentisphaerales bacterium]|nr:RNA polymerase sigma factor [Sedimentisphaerales bacterium]